ncbi:Pancreatic triacylglycerol lipase [Halotydeus destructor]|nr:Pancreatic triacylglycerol lipase [Halotydeus destructor]
MRLHQLVAAMFVVSAPVSCQLLTTLANVMPNMGVLNTLRSGLRGILRRFTSSDTWTDPYLGTITLDPGFWCNSSCLRHIPGLTCVMPISPGELEAQFLVYEPEGDEYVLDWDEINQEPAPSSDKVAILVHGFFENPFNSVWMMRVMKAYRGQGYTVVLVDWRKGNQLTYYQSLTNVRTVSMMVAKIIMNWDISDRLLLVGFSLGGQIIGQAARMIKMADYAPVKTCHALDPAGPWFTGCPQYAIQRQDCEVVEVIHSSAELVRNVGAFTFNFGTRTKSGHCDYWVNCGFSQGALCTSLHLPDLVEGAVRLLALDDTKFTEWAATMICAHHRAAMVYAAQLEHLCTFRIYECPDCGQGYTCTYGNAVKGATVAPFGLCGSNDDVNYYVKSGDTFPHCPASFSFQR